MSESMRDRVFEDVHVALLGAGGDPEKIDRAAIAKSLVAAGIGRSTAYRLIARAVDHFEVQYAESRLPPIPEIVPHVPSRAAERIKVAGACIDGLATVLGGNGIAVVEKLMSCVKAAEDVMRYARRGDGTIRLPKTLLGAADQLRRSLETAAKLHESMVSLQRLDILMEAIFTELKLESPDLQARVLARIRAVTAQHGAAAA